MKQETIDRIRKFTEDRDWDQFHSPANLAKSIVIEAAELLECFQWSDEEYDLQHIKKSWQMSWYIARIFLISLAWMQTKSLI